MVVGRCWVGPCACGPGPMGALMRVPPREVSRLATRQLPTRIDTIVQGFAALGNRLGRERTVATASFVAFCLATSRLQQLFRFVRHLPGRRHGAEHGADLRAGVGQT